MGEARPVESRGGTRSRRTRSQRTESSASGRPLERDIGRGLPVSSLPLLSPTRSFLTAKSQKQTRSRPTTDAGSNCADRLASRLRGVARPRLLCVHVVFFRPARLFKVPPASHCSPLRLSPTRSHRDAMSALSPPSSPPPPSTASSRSSRLSLAFDFSPPKRPHPASPDKAASWRFLSFGRGGKTPSIVPEEDPVVVEESSSTTTTTTTTEEQDEDEPEEWERRQRDRVARRERRKARALLGAVDEPPLERLPPVLAPAPTQDLARFRIDPRASDRFSEFLQRGPSAPAPASPPTPKPAPADRKSVV